MSYGEFIPLGETSGLLDANGEIFNVYDNIMKALADQVRRITKNGNKLGVVAMTDLLRGVDASLDTSDATAIAEYILKDYTAYVNGKKITGTMPYIEGMTVTPSDTDIVAVPAGTYCMGDIIVKAVEIGGGGTDEPVEPDEPTDYDVVTSEVEIADSSTYFEITFVLNNKPVAYKVEYNGNATEDVTVVSVEGEFTYTDYYSGTATAVGIGYDATLGEQVDIGFSASLGRSDPDMVCRLSVTDAVFDAGTYTLKLYYEKGE